MQEQIKKYRLPLDGKFDLTYRCNNNCRHCWLWLHPDAEEKQQELSTNEIYQIVASARQYGTQAWQISGGEPMLRPDFYEIFDYITRKSVHYSLNTNGTLITPEIAQLMKRKGRKMIALYGATATVHDHVTRSPGSFEATMRGINYLKEAGAFFSIQVIPMRDNFHQFSEMLSLAEKLSQDYRIGATWLYLSATQSKSRNQEIIHQRLDPPDALVIDPPNPSSVILKDYEYREKITNNTKINIEKNNGGLFSNCINEKEEFHLDPYGGMSFCPFIKDPELRFSLREYRFSQVWDELIPSVKYKIQFDQEYKDNCGSCESRQDCHWCPVYSYLEHGRYTAKIDYLCQITRGKQDQKEKFIMNHRRFYQIAGVTIMVSSDFPLTDETFTPMIRKFEVEQSGEDTISIRLVPSIPPRSELNLGQEYYRRSPYAIYRQRDSWTYLGIKADDDTENPFLVTIFDNDHTNATVFSERIFPGVKDLPSLSIFPTDQVLLARIFADRQAFFIHSAGIVINGQGFLFVGHSEAGKSTMMKMLKNRGEILGDDRIIVRHWPDGFHIHGTWNPGELRVVSPSGAPLRAILFLEQSKHNELIPISNKRDRLSRILSHVIRALVTEDWWDKSLKLAGKIATEVPAYRILFNKSGEVADVLEQLYD